MFFLVTLTLVSSCSFVPKASENQEYFAECPMLTKQLTLSVTELEGGVCDDDDDLEACLLTLGVVVPVGTLVLSGSIVVAGNTLHWLEYEATCENGDRKSVV